MKKTREREKKERIERSDHLFFRLSSFATKCGKPPRPQKTRVVLFFF
jgi:hypothetical protein